MEVKTSYISCATFREVDLSDELTWTFCVAPPDLTVNLEVSAAEFACV